METIPSLRLGFLRGVFLANHLTSNDNLTRTTKRQKTYQDKLTIQKVALIINNTIKNYNTKTMTVRAWFSLLFQHPARKRSGSIFTTLERHGRAQHKYASWISLPNVWFCRAASRLVQRLLPTRQLTTSSVVRLHR